MEKDNPGHLVMEQIDKESRNLLDDARRIIDFALCLDEKTRKKALARRSKLKLVKLTEDDTILSIEYSRKPKREQLKLEHIYSNGILQRLQVTRINQRRSDESVPSLAIAEVIFEEKIEDSSITVGGIRAFPEAHNMMELFDRTMNIWIY